MIRLRRLVGIERQRCLRIDKERIQMYQSVTIIGNLGRDPEIRYLADGTPVCTFSVAVNARWKDRSTGEARERTTWFRVSAWRATAENAHRYLGKGRQVCVVGELQSDENGGPRVWTGQDGKARSNYELTARTVLFLGKSGNQVDVNGEEAELELPADDNEDIPF